jgi:hypothetical protein
MRLGKVPLTANQKFRRFPFTILYLASDVTKALAPQLQLTEESSEMELDIRR